VAMAIVAPIVVATDPESWPGFVVQPGHGDVCVFYRRVDDARTAVSPSSLVFDAHGQRLVLVDGRLQVSFTEPDGSDELCHLLREWLGYMDAIRWSVADTPLESLLEQCVEHATDCGLYR
jgi:hypothetical protein